MRPSRLLPLLLGLVAGHALAAAPPVREGVLPGADGVPLHYRVVGDGAEVTVVLHGGPATFSSSYLVEDLAPFAAGRTFIFFDQRGAGRSGLPADPALLTAERHVADLEAVRRHFGLERMALLGHSWGAMVATFYARAHPWSVKRLLLLNPAPVDVAADEALVATLGARTTEDEARRQREALDALFTGDAPEAACEAFLSSSVRAFLADPAALARFRGRWCDGGPERARDRFATRGAVVTSLGAWDLRAGLHGVRAPTLVVHGAADAVPLCSSRAWAAAIPSARLLVASGVGHFPWLELPAERMEALLGFLGSGALPGVPDWGEAGPGAAAARPCDAP